MPYFVYILECLDKSLYTGITTDIERRFKEHLLGKGASYTRSHKPVKILFKERHKNRGSALKREFQIKGWGKTKKLALIAKSFGRSGKA